MNIFWWKLINVLGFILVLQERQGVSIICEKIANSIPSIFSMEFVRYLYKGLFRDMRDLIDNSQTKYYKWLKNSTWLIFMLHLRLYQILETINLKFLFNEYVLWNAVTTNVFFLFFYYWLSIDTSIRISILYCIANIKVLLSKCFICIIWIFFWHLGPWCIWNNVSQ